MKFTDINSLAKYTISYYLEYTQKPKIYSIEINQKWTGNAACFVSVYVGNDLRGCIGNYRTFEPLYLNIINNAVSAITQDFRFSPISLLDIPKLKVEVTVLSDPKAYHPTDNNRLIIYLKDNQPGLILEGNEHKALFLPQVWEQLPEPENFLSELCLKANLNADYWKTNPAKYWVFYKRTDL
jgi:uncharacterized protein